MIQRVWEITPIIFLGLKSSTRLGFKLRLRLDNVAWRRRKPNPNFCCFALIFYWVEAEPQILCLRVGQGVSQEEIKLD